MLEAGSRVGDYEIEADLGEGGMARVYRARHAMLDTLHALKVLDPELRAVPAVRQRFLDEARIQAKHLDHPGIVKVTGIVATAEHAALVMELIDGGNLEGELHALVERPDEIRRIMLAVLDAVGHAHAADIIHRDLKPANVLLHRRGAAPAVPKVTDFGIAKLGADGARAKKSTVAGARMGTLAYMSPEQIRQAKDATARSDIFSLGAMLYELATGTVAFDGADDFAIMEKIVHGRYEDPAKRRPAIDPIIAEVIRKALAVDPAARYASCDEMAAALRRVPPPPVKRAERKAVAAVDAPSSWRPLLQIAAILGGVGAIAGAVAGGIYLSKHASQPAGEKVRAPVAADLARYKQALGLTGALRATIVTSQGVLNCDLLEDQAPVAVANFVGLASGLKPWRDPLANKVMRGVSFYEQRTFHRVVPGVSITAGRGQAQVSSSDPGYRFASEAGGAHGAGALATVSDERGNGAEFKILEVEISGLEGTDTVFGTCAPLDIVKLIARVPRDEDERPRTPVTISTVAINAR